MKLTAIEDNHRLYIMQWDENKVEKGTRVGRSLYVYDNIFSRLWGCLKRNLRKIEVDGKNYWVSRASYIKFLESVNLTDTKINEQFAIQTHQKVDKVVIDILCPRIDIKTMNEVDEISKSKQNQLFGRLAHAIFLGDTATAKEMIREGADLDRHIFFDLKGKMEIDKPFFREHPASESYYSARLIREKFTSYSPLALAVARENWELAEFIYIFRGKINDKCEFVGEQHQVYRLSKNSESYKMVNPRGDFAITYQDMWTDPMHEDMDRPERVEINTVARRVNVVKVAKSENDESLKFTLEPLN